MKPGDVVIFNIRITGKVLPGYPPTNEQVRNQLANHLSNLAYRINRCKKPTLKKLVALLKEQS